MSPYGGVLLAEDGLGVNHVIGATEDGHTYFLAENMLPGSSEFAGVKPPDKQTLFVNLFLPGYVYAITGPWKRQGGGGPPEA